MLIALEPRAVFAHLQAQADGASVLGMVGRHCLQDGRSSYSAGS